jgi:hypothetical protein
MKICISKLQTYISILTLIEIVYHVIYVCIKLLHHVDVQYFAANDILTFLQYKNIDISFLFSFGNRCLLTFSTLINCKKIPFQRYLLHIVEYVLNVVEHGVYKYLFLNVKENEISINNDTYYTVITPWLFLSHCSC